MTSFAVWLNDGVHNMTHLINENTFGGLFNLRVDELRAEPPCKINLKSFSISIFKVRKSSQLFVSIMKLSLGRTINNSAVSILQMNTT
jgi:hypothetical protein